MKKLFEDRSHEEIEELFDAWAGRGFEDIPSDTFFAALERRFQPVWVPEPALEEALEILQGVKEHYEAHHNVLITEDALEAAVRLSVGWLPERHLSDKALDLLDEACARARIPTISAPADLSAGLIVTARTVAEVLAGWVGVPAEALLAGEYRHGAAE